MKKWALLGSRIENAFIPKVADCVRIASAALNCYRDRIGVNTVNSDDTALANTCAIEWVVIICYKIVLITIHYSHVLDGKKLKTVASTLHKCLLTNYVNYFLEHTGSKQDVVMLKNT